MALTCNGASHCIMHGNIAFHGCGCMVRIIRHNGDLIGGFGTFGQSPTESHGCMKRKNLCQVIARRVRHSLGVKYPNWFPTPRP